MSDWSSSFVPAEHLVGALELVARHADLLLGVRERALELPDALGLRRVGERRLRSARLRAPDLLEHDEEQRRLAVLRREGPHHEVQRLHAGADVGGQIAVNGLAAGPHGGAQRGAQLDPELVPDEVRDVARGRSSPQHQVAREPRAPEVLDLATRIDHRRGRRELLDHQALGSLRDALRLRLAGARGRHRREVRGPDPGVEARNGARPRGRLAAAEDALPLAHGVEQVHVAAVERLRAPEHQDPARPEGVVQDFDGAPLELGLEVDEEVAARDQIHPRERRISEQIVRREDAGVAELLDDRGRAALLGEEAPEPLRAHLARRRRVASEPGRRERRGVDVGGEDLEPRRDVRAVRLLQHQHGVGVRLLARRAGGHPEARAARRIAGEELREDGGLQQREHLRVAEELGDVDGEVVEQAADLVGVPLELGRVLAHRAQALRRHPAEEAAKDGAPLVAAEVLAGPPDEDLEDVPEPLDLPLVALGDARAPLGGDLDQGRGDLVRGEHAIDEAGRDGRVRHAVEARVRGRLDERRPAVLLDRGEPHRAVGAGPGQHDAHRERALLLGERREERGDGVARLPRSAEREPELVAGEEEAGVRGDDVDGVALHRLPVRDDHHRHRRVPGEYFGKRALVRRI